MNERFTDRQERIRGFSQEVLTNATIGVIGAGATGNELIKNLCLMGAGYAFVADMDTVSGSNLSRNVLNTADDIGKEKAVVAANAFERMNTLGGKADCYSGDIFNLGEGIFRRCDVIMGCLDNIQARLYIARLSKLLRKPHIDLGIESFDWTMASFSGDSNEACYSCTMDEHYYTQELVRHRNSCDVSRKEFEEEKKVPTIVLSAAEVAARAGNELLRVLHHQFNANSVLPEPRTGMHIYTSADDRMLHIVPSVRESCPNHVSYDDFGGVKETSMSAHWMLKDVLQWVADHYGPGYYLSTEKDSLIVSKGFITTGYCKACGKSISIYKNQYDTHEHDLFCSDCLKQALPASNVSNATVIHHFDGTLDGRILNMTLLELGVPQAHILEFDNEKADVMPLFLELTADIPTMMPKLEKQRG